MPSVFLRPSGKMDTRLIPECSALWASTAHPGVFWTLSDSGAKPVIVPIRADGSRAFTGKGHAGGVTLKGATHVDWEALSGDAAGNLIVGDVGNNVSRRRELVCYLLKEPRLEDTEAEVRRVGFAWPDQVAFPDPALNRDCEAMFMLRGRVYLLTKHRRDTLTDLWRADIPAVGDRATRTKIARVDVGGMVTDACLSPDRTRLAILTYRSVWVFDVPPSGEDFFATRALYAPLAPPALSFQIEAITWAEAGQLIIGSEQGDLFRVALSELRSVP